MSSIASFSGLASGIQWRDMVEQIMRMEQQRQLVPVQRQVSLAESRIGAWNSFSTLVSKLSSSVAKFGDGTALDVFTATVSASPTSGKTLLSASASSTATPGTYKVEVLDLARAEKVSGKVLASATAQLGTAYAGAFLVNGKRVEIVGTDTLASVRDKINALNSGTSPSRVTASILTTATNEHRLVLTSDVSGSAGIELVNENGATSTPLQALGLTDGTLASNRTRDGLSQSYRFSSDSAALTTLLGVNPPPSNTSIVVGGKKIAVDFANDTLTTVVSKINAAGGFAEIRSETVNGVTSYRLATSGDVTADSAPTVGTAADSQRAVELLGFQVAGRSAVHQKLTSSIGFTDTAGAAATGATLLTSLRNGTTDALVAGNSISVRGLRGDGTAAEVALSVTSTTTLGDLLGAIGAQFSTATRSATASVDASGKIVVTDGAGGESQLSLSISTSSGSFGFGAMNTTEVGRLREVVNGSDAQLKVDGKLFLRQTNAVSDALTGVTMTLQQAEVGTQVDLTIARDQESMVKSVKAFADAYNAVRDFHRQQNSGTGKPLDGNTSLRTSVRSLTGVLLTDAAVTSAYDRLALVGVALSRDGRLEVDETKLKSALSTNQNDVKALLADVGKRMKTASDSITRSGDGLVASTTTALGRSVSRLNERIYDVEDRLEQRRTQMIKQFTLMEEALGRVQAQGSWFLGQLQSLPQPPSSR